MVFPPLKFIQLDNYSFNDETNIFYQAFIVLAHLAIKSFDLGYSFNWQGGPGICNRLYQQHICTQTGIS